MRYMAKSWLLASFAAIFALLCAAEALAVWADLHVPWFAEMGLVEGVYDGVSSMALWGYMAGGPFIAMFVGILMAVLASDLMSRGFVKNLLQTRGGRVALAASFPAWGLLFSAAAVLIGVAVIEPGVRLAGVAPTLPAPGDFIQWFAQTVLCTAAYASIVGLVALATKNTVAAYLTALFVGGGTVESLLQVALAAPSWLPEAVRDCLDGYLAADLAALGTGAVCDPLSYVQSIATIAAAGALAVAVARRRSLG